MAAHFLFGTFGWQGIKTNKASIYDADQLDGPITLTAGTFNKLGQSVHQQFWSQSTAMQSLPLLC